VLPACDCPSDAPLRFRSSDGVNGALAGVSRYGTFATVEGSGDGAKVAAAAEEEGSRGFLSCTSIAKKIATNFQVEGIVPSICNAYPSIDQSINHR